jgi:DNA-binding MarR family transcriptional regulator
MEMLVLSLNEEYKAGEQIRYMILAAQRQGNRILEEKLRSMGITPSQAEVLRLLEHYEPISLKDLGGLLICESGSPSRLLNSMVGAGMVERRTDEKDRRITLLQLTAKGRTALPLIQQIEGDLYNFMNQTWSSNEMQEMANLLQEFLGNFPVSDSLKKRELWSDHKK